MALVAGEVSGDMLAARLLAGLRPHLPNARFHGIGGARMREQGFVSDIEMDRLTVRGEVEHAFDQTPWRPAERLPVARELGETSLMFLVHPTLQPAEIDKTCEAIRQVMRLASA